VADQAAAFGLRADHEPRGVDQRDHREAPALAEREEVGGLDRRLAGERSGKVRRLVGDHPDRDPVDPRQCRHQLGGVRLAEPGHRVDVGEGLDHRTYVEGLAVVVGEERSQVGLVDGLAALGGRLEVGEDAAYVVRKRRA
jgi:hypothetical protein